MIEVMVSIPEQHAGVPLLLPEAIDSLMMLDVAPGVRDILTLDGTEDPQFTAWAFVLAGLRAGVPAYVQSPSNGRYARIPPSYWANCEPDADMPILFAGIPHAIGQDEDMIGQPIVIWDGSLAPVLEKLLEMAKWRVERAAAKLASSSPTEQPIPIKGTRRREETSEQRALRKFFVEMHKLGHMAGGDQPATYARLHSKYSQSRKSPLGRSAFNKWAKAFNDGLW